MRESILQGKIRAHLITEGWFVVKLINTSKPGMPDLMAIKDGKVIFFEVKTNTGYLSKLQKYIIDCINDAGVKAYVVRTLEQVKQILNGELLRNI
jgi:Holliday junction resolvase